MNQPSNPTPATLAAALRISLAVIGPLGIQKGWWGESDWGNIAAGITSLSAVLYGLWKTHDRQKRLRDARLPFGRSVIR